ncbi:MAG: hypothetical protein R3F39_18220 [Myxococcota bacterium]
MNDLPPVQQFFTQPPASRPIERVVTLAQRVATHSAELLGLEVRILVRALAYMLVGALLLAIGWSLFVIMLGIALSVAVPLWLLLVVGAGLHLGAGVLLVRRGVFAFDPPNERGPDAG